MAKKHFNLETELTGKIDDLTAKLNRANSQVNRYKNKTKQHNKDVQQSFNNTTNSITDVGNAIASGGINSLPALFKATKSAVAGATTGLKGLKKALVSTGIGAIVLAVGSLAAAFTMSEKGAAKFRKIWMPLTVAFDNVLDVLADLGETIIAAFENPQQAVKDLWKLIKDNLVTRVQALGNLFTSLKDIGVNSFNLIGASIKNIWSDQSNEINKAKDEIKSASGEMGKALLQATTGLTDNQLKKTSNFFKQNTAEMKKAAALSDKIYQTDLKERKQTVERAKVEKQIAELKLKSRESELTNVTASIQYLKQAQALEDELLKTDLEIAKARKEIQVEKNTYARSNTENLNAEAELIAKVSQVERTRLDQQAATQRRLNSLQRQQIAQFKAERKEIEKTTDGFKELIGNGQGKPVEIPVKPKLETDKLKSWVEQNDEAVEIQLKLNEESIKASQERAEAFSSAVSSSFTALGSDITESLGLAENGFEGFIGTLADTAIQLIAMMLSQSLASAINGAVISGTATGPAAVFTTPAFIATAVSGVLAAFASIPSFATGGIIAGTSTTGDNILARVNSGEMILNNSQQRRLFETLNGNNSGISGDVEFKISGNNLVGVLNNHSKRLKNTR